MTIEGSSERRHDADKGLGVLVPEATRLYERRREWLEFEALPPDEREALLVTKGSNAVSCISAGMPAPVSAT